MSPCTHSVREGLADLGLPIYDLIDFTTTHLVDRLAFEPDDGVIGLFPVCSVKKMGIVGELERVGRLCSSEVHVADANCCGFAGNRGFMFPELNEWGLRALDEGMPDRVYRCVLDEPDLRDRLVDPHRRALRLPRQADRRTELTAHAVCAVSGRCSSALVAPWQGSGSDELQSSEERPSGRPARPSARLWEAQVDGAGGGVGPAAGDDLAAGVEVDAFGAVHVGVAEQADFPAAEAEVADRHRDRDVQRWHRRNDESLPL